jgi:hypothetical protein
VAGLEQPEKPCVWLANPGGVQWDLEPNGKRVWVWTRLKPGRRRSPEHLVVLLENFCNDVRQNVPVGK